MNFSEILRKLPKEKLYKNPKIKERFSNTEKDLIKKLNKIIDEKRNSVFRKNKKINL
mgnify:CR=1 FL=1